MRRSVLAGGALACVTVVQFGMGIANLESELQTPVLGAFLIASVPVSKPASEVTS